MSLPWHMRDWEGNYPSKKFDAIPYTIHNPCVFERFHCYWTIGINFASVNGILYPIQVDWRHIQPSPKTLVNFMGQIRVIVTYFWKTNMYRGLSPLKKGISSSGS
jgi:hypothetical protein